MFSTLGVPKTPPSKSLESWIWDAACSIRGAKDAPKYKDYILPLIFTKQAGYRQQQKLLCDVFDDRFLSFFLPLILSNADTLMQTTQFHAQRPAA